MIKPNELRIGNYVSYKGGIIKVVNITSFCINEEFNTISGDRIDQIDIDCIDPIPLTTEILEKCGFIKNNLEYWEKETKSNENDLDLEEVNGKFIPVINNEYSVGIEIKYLHQLQNKYFDWYGEELEINLNG